MRKFTKQVLMVFTAIFWVSVELEAQQVNDQPNQSIIYYKDGSIFKGALIDESPLHYIMVLSTLDTINVNKAMVGRFADSRKMSLYRRGKFHYKDGIYVYMTGMLGGGANDNSTGMTDLTIGYRRTPDQSIGIGAGLAISDIVLAGTWMTHQFTTVFLYGRQYLGKSRARFYFDSRVGYGFPRMSDNVWGDDHNGGVHFQPGLGLHFASKSGLKWHLGLARFIQRTTGEDVTTGPFNQPIETDFKLWYSRTVFKIGMEIK